MANRYLLSFCNNYGRLRLAILSPHEVERVIDLGENFFSFAPHGTGGMALDGDSLFLVLQSTKLAVIGVFDRQFVLHSEIEAPGAVDLHGILPRGDDLLLVSSGTNELLSVDRGISKQPSPAQPRVVWTDRGPLRDRDHLNDLQQTPDGRVLMSSFGPARPDGMRCGTVIEVETRSVLIDGLREPHSLWWWDSHLYVLESVTGDLVRMHPGAQPERVLGIVGYARGLAIDSDYIAIGKSGYRERSRSRLGDNRSAPLAIPTAGVDLVGYSGVCFISQRDGAVSWVETTNCGSEIYQILPLTD